MKFVAKLERTVLTSTLLAISVFCLSQSVFAGNPSDGAKEDQDPPEVSLGHRLFQETRFAHFFYKNSSGINSELAQGDPTVAIAQSLRGNMAGPYAGKSMNCASCHFVDEKRGDALGGMRSYADFIRRSPIPDRGDGRTTTTRNAPTMVNAAIAHTGGLFLHYDGEFTTMEDLVKAGLTGRNLGWLADESQIAIHQIAQVIREDDGQGDLAKQYWGSYRDVLASQSVSVPEAFKLPAEFRLDVKSASDAQIFATVAKLVAAYSQSLVYVKDEKGRYNGSPYDLFLEKNNLPQLPDSGETPVAYARRLRAKLDALNAPQFVSSQERSYKYQKNLAFEFGASELAGLKIFLAEQSSALQSASRDVSAPARGKVGNCVSCHAPPDFTDFKFHNTGVAQEEYDSIHGLAQFARLHIPDTRERARHPNTYYPASALHPRALGVFEAVPSKGNHLLTDLGLWNVFANPAMPRSQDEIKKLMCEELQKNGHRDCDEDRLLKQTIAFFKTPSMRDLNQSDPYLHNGSADNVDDVIKHYIRTADLARKGKLRNGSIELKDINLVEDDIAPLSAFLRSLNEDYH